MSGRINDVEMHEFECSEKENGDDLVDLKNESSCRLADSRVDEDNGDLNLRRSLRGRVRALPARFSDSEMYSEKRRKTGESRDCDVKKERKGMGSDGLDNGRGLDEKSAEIESNLENDDDIPCVSSLSLANGDDEKVMALAIDEENKPIEEKKRIDKRTEKKIFNRLENFGVGDVVWAKYSRSAIAWPALVIDPLEDAPEIVFEQLCSKHDMCNVFWLLEEGNKGDQSFPVSHNCLIITLQLGMVIICNDMS